MSLSAAGISPHPSGLHFGAEPHWRLACTGRWVVEGVIGSFSLSSTHTVSPVRIYGDDLPAPRSCQVLRLGPKASGTRS